MTLIFDTYETSVLDFTGSLATYFPKHAIVFGEYMNAIKIPIERFVFIEMLAFWMGCIRNKDLEKQFGITRQQAYIVPRIF